MIFFNLTKRRWLTSISGNAFLLQPVPLGGKVAAFLNLSDYGVSIPPVLDLKVADTISDFVVDACLEDDKHSRVACETLVKDNMVVLAGEITTDSECNAPDSCNAVGVCLSNYLPSGLSCGDPTDSDCTAPDQCDGAGTWG